MMITCVSELHRYLMNSPKDARSVFSKALHYIVLALGLFLLQGNSSDAHDYWFEFEGQDYVLYRGHHFIKHEEEEIVPYDPAIVKNIYCASQGGAVRKIAPPLHYPARIPGPCTALTVEMDTGYWTQTWTETLNLPKDKISDAVMSWQALESTKLLNTWTEMNSPTPLSNGLEILVEKNPFVLENGQKLRLQVTLNGQPCKDVTVAYNGKPRGLTGKDGRINIRVRRRGLQVITGSIKEPPHDPAKADKLLRATALPFELPERP